MSVLGTGDGELLNAYAKTQGGFTTAVRRLASGLRVQTAADDPSGLAIAETLQAKANGLDEGTRKLQDASNALTVADGALQSINGIVQRLRSLTIEAASDFTSNADRQNLQYEIDALVKEVDSISKNTTFNGRALLDGSASSKIPNAAGQVYFIQNDGLQMGSNIFDQIVDPNTPGIQQPPFPIGAKITVDSSGIDPVSGLPIVNVTRTLVGLYDSFGGTQTTQLQLQDGLGDVVGGVGPIPGGTFQEYDQQGLGTNVVLSYNLGPIAAADVGKEAFLITIDPQTKAAGAAINVNSGDGEGSINTVDIPATSAQNLGINHLILGTDTTQAAACEGACDYALNQITSTEAIVGAQTVALGEAATNSQIASVNTQASESNIRDLNVAQELSGYVRDQILTQLQTTMIGRQNTNAQLVTQLLHASGIG